MRNHYSLIVGAALIVIAIIALRALLDRERPRLLWARRCFVVLAIAAVLGGILTGVEVSGRNLGFVSPRAARQTGAFCRGVTVGLLFALGASGQWRLKPDVKQDGPAS